MSTTELIPMIQALKHAEKLRLMAFLVDEIAREDGVFLDEREQDDTEYLLKHSTNRKYLIDALHSGNRVPINLDVINEKTKV